MNLQQRNANRRNSALLMLRAKEARCARHTCENCGEKGGHWVAHPRSLADIVLNVPPTGHWLCDGKLKAYVTTVG